MKIRVLLASAGILGALPALAGPPRILYVAKNGDDFSLTPTDPNTPLLTIDGAIARATSGDEIRIGGGTFRERNLQVAISARFLGVGPDDTIIEAAAAPGLADNRVFSLAAGFDICFDGLAIKNGVAKAGTEDDGSGGAIHNAGSNLWLNNVLLSHNRSDNGALGGGAIYHALGELVVTNSKFLFNMAGAAGSGGALYMAEGAGRIEGTRFESNTAGDEYGELPAGDGGAVRFGYGVSSMRLKYLEFALNRAGNGFKGFGGSGGAICNDGDILVRSTLFRENGAGNGGDGLDDASGGFGGALINLANLKLKNSTLVANFAGNSGLNSGFGGSGGAFDSTYSTGLMEVFWCTVTDNLAGLGVWGDGWGAGGHANTFAPVISVQNSVFDGNTVGPGGGAPDLAGDGITSLGYNLIGNTGPFTIGEIALGDLLDIDPMLQPLADNGGPTLSRMPMIGSPLNRMVETARWLSSDQRGFKRANPTSIGAVDRDALARDASETLARILLRSRHGHRKALGLRLSATEADRYYQVFSGDTPAQLRIPELTPGGRIALTSRTRGSGAPMLMDIPYLGTLLRNADERERRKFLMVLVTPAVISPEDP